MSIVQRILFLISCFLIGCLIGMCSANVSATVPHRKTPNVSVKQLLPAPSGKEGRGARVDSRIKIAILDTGYEPAPGMPELKLCKTGHYDFATMTKRLAAPQGHGTVVGTIVADKLESMDYCAVIYQVGNIFNQVPQENIIKALNMAADEGVVAVNISLEGNGFSYGEYLAIKRVVGRGARVFVAAGNENKDLDETCNAYPACYELPGLEAVGALTPDFVQREQYSNYGSKVKLWYRGRVQFLGQVVQGTSYASPQALADYVYSVYGPKK